MYNIKYWLNVSISEREKDELQINIVTISVIISMVYIRYINTTIFPLDISVIRLE